MSEHQRLINAVKLHTESQDGQRAEMQAATVTSVGPDGATAKVKFLTSGNSSGWLPVGCVGIGANSIIAPPNIGDLVIVETHEGDAENWVITKRLFSTANPAPNSPATSAAVKSGELAIIMHDGSYLHFTNDGTMHTGASKWTHTGDLQVTGEVTRGFGTGDAVTVGKHTHNQPNDGHGDTEAATNAPNAGT